MLSWISGVDWLPREPRFEVVYGLLSLSRAVRVNLRVALGGENPRVPTVTGVWPTADWLERETYDFYGIEFTGHPDLRAHPAARGLGGLAAAQGLAARIRRGGLHAQHAGSREALARAPEARAEEGEIPCAVRR